MEKKLKNPHSDFMTFLVGLAFAAITIIAGILLSKVLWPAVKWLAMKAWAKLRGKNKATPDTAEDQDESAFPEIDQVFKGNGLHTPDIFKDSPNLAVARQFKF